MQNVGLGVFIEKTVKEDSDNDKMNSLRLSLHCRRILMNFGRISHRSYAAKVAPGAAAAAKIMPSQQTEDQAYIEMDTEKLTKYCCCNYLKDGTDIPIKPDSEYPAWLLKMRLGPPPTLDELDPNDLAYWKRYDEFALKERLERRKHFYAGLFTQRWLTDVKKIPEEDIKGDTSQWEKTRPYPE